MRRLAVVTTHPIQYYAPLFKLLHQRRKIELKVFYTWGRTVQNKHDPGFNKLVNWDIPLLEGYSFEWVENIALNPGSGIFSGIVTPGLTKQIEAFSPDAILFLGWAYNGHLKALRYFKNKVPVYFRGDSTLIDEKPGIKSYFRTQLLKWVYKHIDHAFYCGTNNKAYFKKFGLKESQLNFAPHAVDNERFALNRSEEALNLRKELGISDSDLLVLFAGKFEEKKDPLLLIKAFLELGYSNCHLLIVGNGALEGQMKQMSSNIKQIHFMDFQNQSFMPVLYQACQLFCLPSSGPGETWGLAVNEAMASGKAILISDRTGCGVDLVKTGVNGEIFKNRNIHDLVRKLKALLDDEIKLSEKGQRSKMIIQDWNFNSLAEAIEYKLNIQEL